VTDQDPRQQGSTNLLAPAVCSERRRARRANVAFRARLRPYNDSNELREEIRPTTNASRHGIYFTTELPTYSEHMHLYVACPFSECNTQRDEEPARVIRVDRRPDGHWGIALLFLRGAAFHHNGILVSDFKGAQ
jgi:hypothetical protein